jgi:hypothetical protein
MRLLDEILTQSSYLDLGSIDPIEYVAVSDETIRTLTAEIMEEKNVDSASIEDIEATLTLKILIMPTLFGIDYRFFKEVKH